MATMANKDINSDEVSRLRAEIALALQRAKLYQFQSQASTATIQSCNSGSFLGVKFLEIRKARKQIFDFDVINDWECSFDFDLELYRCDEIVD